MTVARFYRAAVWLPIVVSGIALAGIQLVGTPINYTLNQFVMVFVIAGYFGGIPYLALAIWASWYLRSGGERTGHIVALLLPILMIPACALYALALTLWNHSSLGDVLFLTMMSAAWAIPLGYCYVAFVFAVRWLALRRGWLTLAAAAPAA